MLTLRLRRGLAAALALVIAAAVAPAASAHSQLIRSTPGEGQTVERLERIELEFSSALLEVGHELRLETPEGDTFTLEGRLSSPQVLVADVPQPALVEGTLRLHWRVVAEDGHPIEDTLRFRYREPLEGGTASTAEPTVGATADPTEAASVEPTAEASADATAQPSASSEPSVTAEPTLTAVEPTTDPSANPAVEEATSSLPLGWILGGAAVLAAALAVLVAMRRRPAPETGSDTTDRADA